MLQGNCVKPIVLRSVDSSTLAADTWDVITEAGAGPKLEGSCFLIRITNDSNKDVILSFDGSNEHEVVLASGSLELNFQTNSSPSAQVSKLRKGTSVYARGVAGTGLIYLSGYFNAE